MDPSELRELGRLPSQKVRAALERGDFTEALALCDALPKEFVVMHKGLRLVVELLLAHNEAVFRRTQEEITQQIRAAIEAGDAAAALELLERKHRQHLDIHDAQLGFKATSYAWLYRHFGDEALYQCHRHIAQAHRKAFDQWEQLPTEDFVRVTAHLFSLHSEGRFTVHEDEQKFSFVLDPCGSGGKMTRDGHNDPPDARYPRVMMAQPMTFSRPAFPSYCSHCAVWNSIMPIEWYGHPQWVHTPPASANEPCVFHIYRNPQDIPAEYYRLVGKEKPAAPTATDPAPGG